MAGHPADQVQLDVVVPVELEVRALGRLVAHQRPPQLRPTRPRVEHRGERHGGARSCRHPRVAESAGRSVAAHDVGPARAERLRDRVGHAGPTPGSPCRGRAGRCRRRWPSRARPAVRSWKCRRTKAGRLGPPRRPCRPEARCAQPAAGPGPRADRRRREVRAGSASPRHGRRARPRAAGPRSRWPAATTGEPRGDRGPVLDGRTRGHPPRRPWRAAAGPGQRRPGMRADWRAGRGRQRRRRAPGARCRPPPRRRAPTAWPPTTRTGTGSTAVASCQAATTARASRAGSPSAPTGDDSATSARSTSSASSRASRSCSLGSTAKHGSPGRSMH